MFDITSSKLLILAIVALIVVGPKDLPILLRTVGKYLGVIRRHAAEFRSQFDEAMREAELDGIKKEFENVSREVRATLDEGSRAIDSADRSVSCEHAMLARGLHPCLPAALPTVETPGEATLPAATEETKERDRGAA